MLTIRKFAIIATALLGVITIYIAPRVSAQEIIDDSDTPTGRGLVQLPKVRVIPVANSDSDVGQNTDKQVTQDEPNTTENPDSPSIAGEPDLAPVTDQPETSGAGGEPVQATTEPTTAVLGETNVKTNPQDNVGGVEEVNKLFKDEDIGASAPEPEQSNAPIIAGLIASIVVILALFGGIFVLKKNKSDS